MERDEARTGAKNKEEGGEVEKRRRRRKAGERMERSEETEVRGSEREKEGGHAKSAARRVRGRNYRGLFVAYGAQRTLSWRVAKRPLLGW